MSEVRLLWPLLCVEAPRPWDPGSLERGKSAGVWPVTEGKLSVKSSFIYV